jgi:hypothetical protein
MKKIVEFQVYTDLEFEETPLHFQNTIYLLLDKFKTEGNKIKIGKSKSLEKTIRRDALELVNLGIVSQEKKTDYVIKIYEKSEKIYRNEGLNIEIDKKNEKIKLRQIKSQR